MPHGQTPINTEHKTATVQADTVGQMLFHTLAPDDELKFGRNQRVQAYVNQVKASILQLGQKSRQVHAVGRHSDGFQALQLLQLCCRGSRRQGIQGRREEVKRMSGTNDVQFQAGALLVTGPAVSSSDTLTDRAVTVANLVR